MCARCDGDADLALCKVCRTPFCATCARDHLCFDNCVAMGCRPGGCIERR